MPSRTEVLHVLGGGQWQLPTIELAKSLGYKVLVTDLYRERPGYALADIHEVVDIADPEATLEVARRHRIDGIVCDTTDVGVPTAAYVAEKLGLPGISYETACNFTNKFRMRSLTAQSGISSVRFRSVASVGEMHEAAEGYGFPFVVKPVDSQSSRGVHRVDRPEQISVFFEDAFRSSRSHQVLAEEFLPGTEATVEGLCLDGNYITLGISDKVHFEHRPEVARRLTYPPAFDSDTIQEITRVNEAVAKALGLVNGVTHAEYMVDRGRVRLVEIAARGGGSLLYSDVAPYLSGIDVPRIYLEFLMGKRATATARGGCRAANLQFFSFPPGKVRAIQGLEEARGNEGVHKILLEFAVGDVLKPPDDDRSRPGLMLVLGETRAQVLETSRRVEETVRVEVE
jgi:carbamoyl-phosphate synthase large subunit